MQLAVDPAPHKRTFKSKPTTMAAAKSKDSRSLRCEQSPICRDPKKKVTRRHEKIRVHLRNLRTTSTLIRGEPIAG
jgi:hypothetical protein